MSAARTEKYTEAARMRLLGEEMMKLHQCHREITSAAQVNDVSGYIINIILI